MAGDGGVKLSRLDKVFWPDEGLTKGHLVEYMDAVSGPLLRYLRGRPLTVKRYPDGIDGQAFYQKDTPKYAPSWIRTVTLHAGSAGRDVRYTVAGSRRTLRWLANQAAIELHPWLSRIDRLDRPDFLVFDVDPPEGRFDLAVRVAEVTGEALGRRGLEGVVKTSGAKGVHVFVPLVHRYDYPACQRAARRLAEEAEALEPGLITTEFRKAERGGRVFLDYTRMGRGQHVVAPYSPRARPGAPVSFPVPWQQLGRADPPDFTIRTVPRLLARDPDPWRSLAPGPRTLPPDLVA